MHRKPRPTSQELQTLLNERDDLQIQLSLAIDARSPDPVRIAQLSSRLMEVDLLISEKRRVF